MVLARFSSPDLARRLEAAESRLADDPAEAVRVADEVLTGSPPQSLDAAQAALIAGQGLYRQSLLAEAEEALGRAALAFRQNGERQGELEALTQLGRVKRERGVLAEARECFEAAVPLARELGLLEAEADLLNLLAGVMNAQADHAQALDRLSQALAIIRRLGNRQAEANYLNNIGVLQTDLGDYAQALQSLFQAYQLFQEVETSPRNRAINLTSIGNLYREMQEGESALAYYGQALQVARAHGERTVEIAVLINQAETHRAGGNLGLAEETFRLALGLAREHGLTEFATNCLDGLGHVYIALGRAQEAMAAHHEALGLARGLGARHAEIDALLGLGEDHLLLGDVEGALGVLRQALELTLLTGQRTSAYQAHELLYRAYKAAGDLPQALHHLEEHHRQERAVFNEESERKRRVFTTMLELERARVEAEQYRLLTEAAQKAREEAEAEALERTRELERAQLEIVSRLALAAEFRDDKTGEHTWRVGRNAALIAEELGWSAEEVELLRLAARLHDVGKIGIPDSILLKRGRLSPEEFAQMRAHTTIGGRILSGGRSKLLRIAEEIAISHHERWDGRGYPHGLRGEEIPLSGRIVAVADVLDALTNERPYKRAWSLQDALIELERQSGHHFDPQVVQACLRAFRNRGLFSDEDMHRFDQEVSRLARLERLQLGIREDADQSALERLLAERTRELEEAHWEAQSLARRMERIAHTDPLTGLSNRRAFEHDLEAELARAQRYSYPLSVLALDLDGLKRLNDVEGHSRGDELLKVFSHQVQTALSPIGRVYRTGGDEYAAILPYIPATRHFGIRAVLSEVMARIRSAGFPAAGVSIGLAAFPHEAADKDELLRLSDQRMYQDKHPRR